MCIVLFLDGVQGVLIRVGKVEVIAQHGNINAVLFKQMPQIQRVAGGQCTGRTGDLLQGFAQSNMGAGKALLPHQRQHLLNGQLFGVVETQAELDHGKTPPFPHGAGMLLPLYNKRPPAERGETTGLSYPHPEHKILHIPLCSRGKTGTMEKTNGNRKEVLL